MSTNSAVNPHSGANVSGVVLASATQSIASPRAEKNTERFVSPDDVARGTTNPFGCVTAAPAEPAKRRTAIAENARLILEG